ncbi:MAG: restriction endonuclease subunit S [Bacteroidales bacterium]|nr:restriction endonuclease subunit S [Bacteroidales bacterium]
MIQYPIYKLVEICDILNGFAFKSSNYVSDGLRVIRITNVKKGYVIDEEPQFYPIETQEELKKYVLKKGDLLISLTGNVGRVGILNEELLPAALNQRVGCLRVKDKSLVSLQYLFHLFNTDSFEKDCINSSKGIAQKNMSTEWLKEYEIPLPPLATQRAIVTRIESLFAELDKGVEKLKTAQQQLKVYRQAVLNDCLTKDSEKWEKVKLGEVAEKIFDGPFGTHLKSDDYVSSGIRVVRLENIKAGYFDDSKQSYVTPEKYEIIKRHTVYPTDLIMSTFISEEVKVCQMPKHIEFAVNKADCIGIRLKASANNDFIKYYLSLRSVYHQLEIQVHGATRPRVNTTQIKNIEINLPPLPTQQCIVQEIETRLSACDEVEKNINESLQQAEALRQSILKKAFEGELV